MTEGRQSGRRTRLGRARSMLLVLLLGAVLTSCETVKSLLETPAVEPVVLELSHQHLRLTPGERFRLHATLRNEAGVKMGGDVSWESTDRAYGLVDTAGNVTGLSDSGSFTVVARSGELSASAQVELAPAAQCENPRFGEAVNAELFGMQVLQSVEAWPERVPLITGRPATVRVSLLADAAAPVRVPAEVTVHATRNGAAVGSLVAEGPDCLPTTPRLAQWDATFNAVLPTEWLGEGLGLYVTATVEAGDGEQKLLRYPREGHVAFEVVTPAPFDVVFVPLALSVHGVTAQVAEEELGDALIATYSVFPLDEVSASVRAPLTYAVDDDFSQVLDVLGEAWLLDGAATHYHALAPAVIEKPAAAGIAAVGGPISWSLVATPDQIEEGQSKFGGMTIAHELGHNFSLRHASCGLDGNHDPTFPYFDGRTASFGINRFYLPNVEHLVQPDMADLMSYCRPRWISDHNYHEVLKYRQRPPAWLDWGDPESAARPAVAPDDPAAATVLLVSGRVSGGVASLRPTFAFEGQPRPPVAGEWRWQLLADNGAVLVEVPFEPYTLSVPAVDHGPGSDGIFAFTVPVTSAQLGAASTARVLDLSGSVIGDLTPAAGLAAAGAETAEPAPTLRRSDSGFVVLEWNAGQYEHVMVRHATTGRLLARGSGGSLTFASAEEEFQVLFSAGLRSTSLWLQVEAR